MNTEEVPFETLVGKTLGKIIITEDKTKITFVTKDETEEFELFDENGVLREAAIEPSPFNILDSEIVSAERTFKGFATSTDGSSSDIFGEELTLVTVDGYGATVSFVGQINKVDVEELNFVQTKGYISL